MTTATKTKTIEYAVTLNYCATEWVDADGEDSTDYECQPTASRTVVVELPSDATPFDVYCVADAEINDDDILFELSEEGGAGLDGDGFSIAFNSKEYSIGYDSIKPTASWSEYHVS